MQVHDRGIASRASLGAVALLGLLVAPAARAADRADDLIASFDQRRDALLESLAGQPLTIAPIEPPIRPERGEFARDYSYSIVNFALRALWLDEQHAAAHAALQENCRFYLGNRRVRDEHDSFYWSADVLCRIVEFFGERGSRAPGRLRPETEQLILEMMWGYCHDNSRISDADFTVSRTWWLSYSENHHHQMLSTLWHFSQLVAARPELAHRRYADHGTPAEHAAAWSAYGKAYLRERARKGLLIELASKGYNVYTLKGIYNWYDFADDPELRRLAGCVLDLYWASWAQEQIDGVRGGAASRVYNGPGSLTGGGDNIGRVAGYYLGWPEAGDPVENDFTPLTSEYRMPALVVDLALDAEARGVYEVRQRAMGLAEPGYADSPNYRLRPAESGIVRYAYCTPEFVLGTALLPARPRTDWVTISAQNRWHGAIFAGHRDARIVPECTGAGRKGTRTHNAQWSVQDRGTLIVQKLRTSAQAGAMRVWFAAAGLTAPVERGGWAFVAARGAYAAVRPARGSHRWEPAEGSLAGRWLRCDDESTPVILEVARKQDFSSFEAFQRAVAALVPRFDGERLEYRGLSGTDFTFDASQHQAPRIDGELVDYAPERVYDSPFMQSAWNSGVTTLRFGNRELTIDVRAP